MCLVPIKIDDLVPYEPSVIRTHLENLTKLLVEYGTPGHNAAEILVQIGSPTVVRIGDEWLLLNGIHRCTLLKCLGADTVLCVETDKIEKAHGLILEARLAAGMKGLNNVPLDATEPDRERRNLEECRDILGMAVDLPPGSEDAEEDGA